MRDEVEHDMPLAQQFGCYRKRIILRKPQTRGIHDNVRFLRCRADLFFIQLEDLCRTLEIPTLSSYGISAEAFFEKADKMAEDALASGSPANTIKTVTKQDILKIYADLWTD